MWCLYHQQVIPEDFVFRLVINSLSLCNLRVYQRVDKILTLGPILNQLNLVHIFNSNISKIHFNIILPPMSNLPSGILMLFGSKVQEVTRNWRILHNRELRLITIGVIGPSSLMTWTGSLLHMVRVRSV